LQQDNIFFLPVSAVCQREVLTCPHTTGIVSAAALMQQRQVSSIVVSQNNLPTGIMSDHDLRNKVVSRGIDPNGLIVSDIMSAPLITLREDDFVFEALYLMSRHSIHRVVVVDSRGQLTGIISHTDILSLQARSPQQLLYAIEEARTVEELKHHHQQVEGLVVHLIGTGVSTPELVRMISHLNDRILIRLISLLRNARYADLADDFAFIVLGSEGRREQTLTTDQDNAIIYSDDLSAGQVERIREFSEELIDSLIAIGVPPCPGGIMAKNEPWRRSLSGWKNVLDSWLRDSGPQNIMNGSMFFDLRTLYGNQELEAELKRHIAAYLSRNSTFLARSAKNVTGFKTPIGWFGRFKLEKKGPHKGKMDIKKAGIFAITEGIKVLALESGELDDGTLEHIRDLTAKGVLKPDMAENIEASFNFLVTLRLRGQAAAIRAGEAPSNYIDLAELNHMERGRLRLALETVDTLQQFLELHFQLDFLR
jgi:CBS domain-containing protein